jgi:chromosome segregation ATPase
LTKRITELKLTITNLNSKNNRIDQHKINDEPEIEEYKNKNIILAKRITELELNLQTLQSSYKKIENLLTKTFDKLTGKIEKLKFKNKDLENKNNNYIQQLDLLKTYLNISKQKNKE